MKKLKRKVKKILIYLAVFAFVVNSTLISELIPEAKAASTGDVVINEINWAGSTLSSSDEWVELYNTTGSPIILTNWVISGAATSGGDLIITSRTIPAYSFFLISNYGEDNANSKLNVAPDLFNTSLTLYNSDVQYVLKDENGYVIDTADDGSGTPLKGDSINKYSMERNRTITDGIVASSWHTATVSVGFDAGATDRGTPKSKNSNYPYPTAPNSNFLTVTQNVPGTDDFISGAAGSVDNGTIVKVYKDSSLTTLLGSGNANEYGSFAAFSIGDNQADANDKVYIVSEDLAGTQGVSTEMTNDTTGPTISNISANPNPFSPDDNGVKDTTNISYNLSDNLSGSVNVTINITGPVEGVSRFWNLIENQPKSMGSNSQIWDGTLEDGITPVPQGTYEVKIKATDSANNSSDWTQPIEVTIDLTGPTGNLTLDSHILNLTNNNNSIISGTYTGGGGIQLSTIEVQSDVNNIVVQFTSDSNIYQKNATFYPDTGNFTTENSNQYENVKIAGVDVLPDGFYQVKVLAFDSNGASIFKDLSGGLTIDTVAPQSPTNLQVTAKTPNSISLSWTKSGSGDVAGYKLYQGTAKGVWSSVRDTGNVTSYTLTGLNPAITYYFYVTAYDKASNESSPSNVVEEKTTSALSSGISTKTEEPKGIVESAQAASPQNENKEEAKNEEQKTANKAKSSLLLIAIIILILGTAGYYYYNSKPDKFKKIKFPKLPGIK